MPPGETMTKTIAPSVLSLTLMMPALGWAQGFQPREGCTHVVSIQSEGCYVRHVVTCPEMGPGLLVYGTGADGVVVATVFDPDGAVLYNGTEDALKILQDRTDLFSLAALTAAGTDSFDYTLRGRDGADVHFTGTAALTGETVEIDGRSLLVVEAQQSVTPLGMATIESESLSYYDADLGLVLTAETRDRKTGEVQQQRRPVEFLFPGEDGAIAEAPSIGCEG